MTAVRLPVLALLSLSILGGGARAAGQAGPSLSVDPPAQAVALDGDPFEVAVLVGDIAGPDGLGGYTLLMEYDPAVAHALAVVDGGFVMETENAVACPATGIDNDAGRLAQFCFTIPIFVEQGAVTSAPRALVRVTFEAVGAGATDLDISGSLLTDPQGNGIAATITGGTLTVQPAAGPDASEPSTDTESPAGVGSEEPPDEDDSPAEQGAGESAVVGDASGGGQSPPSSGAGPATAGNGAWLLAAAVLVASGCMLVLAAWWLNRRIPGGTSP